jgi:hypothetical protein
MKKHLSQFSTSRVVVGATLGL